MDNANPRPAEMSADDLPLDVAERVRAELDGERLVWLGQPRPELYARQSGCLVVVGAFFVVFSLLGTAIPIGIGAFAIGGVNDGGWLIGAPLMCFGLFGLAFLAIGIVLVTSPIWMRKMAAKCCYVLTDRRAITWEPQLWGGTKVRSYTRHGFSTISRTENADGSGSLVFHEQRSTDSEGATTTVQYGFMHIDGVRQVERLLRKTLLEEEAT